MRVLLLFGLLAPMMFALGCGDEEVKLEKVIPATKPSSNPNDKPKAQTVDDQPPQQPDIFSLVNEDFVAAIVVRPNIAAHSRLMGELLADEPEVVLFWEAWEREIGVDPKQIDEMILLFDRDSLQLPIVRSIEDPRLMPALIVQYQEGVEHMVSFPPFTFTDQPQEKLHEGKRYLVGGQLAVHFLSKTSFVASSEEKLKRMLSTKDARNTLAGELSKGGSDKHLIVSVDLHAIGSELESLRDASSLRQLPEFAWMAKDLSDAKTLTFTVDLTDNPLLQLAVVGKDSQAATELERNALTLLKLARAALLNQTDQPEEDRKIPATLASLLPFTRNVLNNLRVATVGNQLVLDLETPHAELPSLLESLFQQAREYRKQQTARIKLIQIALSMFGTYSVDSLLPRAIADSEGNPLLSWRVALLPYIGNRELYSKFHLDEPWDSPHNKSLIAKMPDFYRFPDDPEDGRTRILAVVGKEAAFDVKVPPFGELDDVPLGRTESEFEDGRAGTMILVVVGRDKAVPWTKPADFSLDSPKLLDELGTLPEDTFWALMRDMSPRRLPSDINEKTLRALATIVGGERIDPTVALDDEEFAEELQEENAEPHRSFEVARKLEALGAEVKIDEQRRIYSVDLPEDYKLPEGESVDEAMPLLQEIPDLKSLSLSACKIAPASFAHLAELKNLESLTANYCGFTDKAAKHLSGLTSLVHLNLGDNPITDETLSALESMDQLESLNLAYTKVTGHGFQRLPQNGKLREISLDETPLIDNELVHLGKIRSLESLDFSDASVGDSGLEHLASLPALKHIALTRTQMTDRGLEHLGKIKSLESLFLHDTNIKGSGLVHLVELPRLEDLNLWQTPLDADQAIKHIAKMSNLKSLTLMECDITDAHVSQLLPLKELSSLALDETQITDKSMEILVKLPKLSILSVEGTKVTSEAIERFSQAKPDSYVSN